MSAPATWRPPSLVPNPLYRYGLMALAGGYVLWSVGSLEVDWNRVAQGFPRAGGILGRMFPPDFSRWELLLRGVTESVEMALAASFVGMIVAVPLGLCAAVNLAPMPVYLLARSVIVFTRTFHEVIVASSSSRSSASARWPGC